VGVVVAQLKISRVSVVSVGERGSHSEQATSSFTSHRSSTTRQVNYLHGDYIAMYSSSQKKKKKSNSPISHGHEKAKKKCRNYLAVLGTVDMLG